MPAARGGRRAVRPRPARRSPSALDTAPTTQGTTAPPRPPAAYMRPRGTWRNAADDRVTSAHSSGNIADSPQPAAAAAPAITPLGRGRGEDNRQDAKRREREPAANQRGFADVLQGDGREQAAGGERGPERGRRQGPRGRCASDHAPREFRDPSRHRVLGSDVKKDQCAKKTPARARRDPSPCRSELVDA